MAETKVVAKVEGLQITWGEYQKAYRQRVETYRRLFKDKLDDAMIERLKLADLALDSLIEGRLLLVIAQEEGLRVSDDEVFSYIEGHPAFQVGGYFNKNTYISRLSNLGMTPTQYEESVRQLLIVEQVQATFKDGIHITEAELRSTYQQEQEQVSTTFLLLKGDDFTRDVEADEKALETFYQEHKTEFAVPERRKIAYVTFRPETHEKEVILDKGRIKERYELNLERYRKPERIRARHILLKLEQNASAEDDAKVKAKADALLKEARGGKNFTELAKAHSQGPTAPKGGDLGFFTRGKMVKPFEEVAFKLEAGQVGGPVRTPFGYHLIKVEEKEPESVRAFEEVEGEIRQALVAEEARYLAQDATYEALESIRSSTEKGEGALSGLKGATLSTTKLFASDESLTEMGGDDEAVRSAAFALQVGDVSNVIEGKRNSYILALVKVDPEHVPPLKAIRAQVVAAYSKSQGRRRVLSEADALAKSAKNVDDLTKAAKDLKLSTVPTSTGWFARRGPVAKVETESSYIRTAFKLPSGIFSTVVTPEGAYVLTVTGLKGVTDEGFASAKKTFEARLRLQKANSIYSAWIQRLRQTHDVEVDSAFFPDYRVAKN